MNGLPTFVHLNVIASEFGMFFSQPSADGSVPMEKRKNDTGSNAER